MDWCGNVCKQQGWGIGEQGQMSDQKKAMNTLVTKSLGGVFGLLKWLQGYPLGVESMEI